MQETTRIKLKRNLEIGIKVSFAIGLVFFIISNNYSYDMQLWTLYMGLFALAIVIGSILGFIHFVRPTTEDEQEKARNSIVVKLFRVGMVIVLIYGVISFPKGAIKGLISAII